MATKACPVCGTGVKLENLPRHVARVHPGRESSVKLSLEEQRVVRTSARGAGPNLPLRKYAVVGVLAVLVLAGLAFALPRLVVPNPHDETPMHLHPRLGISIEGQSAPIPANIGIDPSLWRDHTLDDYGMMGSMAPLHTHDASGEIHVESRVTRDYTLGEFFRIWGQSFDGQQVLGHPAGAGHRVRMLVDGAEQAPTYSLVFRDGMQIQIACDSA